MPRGSGGGRRSAVARDVSHWSFLEDCRVAGRAAESGSGDGGRNANALSDNVALPAAE